MQKTSVMHLARRGGGAACGASYPGLASMATPDGGLAREGLLNNVTCPACREIIEAEHPDYRGEWRS